MSDRDVCPYPGCGTRFYSELSREAHKKLYPGHFKKPCGAPDDPNRILPVPVDREKLKHVNCKCVTEKPVADPQPSKPKQKKAGKK